MRFETIGEVGAPWGTLFSYEQIAASVEATSFEKLNG
jgi:hypothetical protein